MDELAPSSFLTTTLVLVAKAAKSRAISGMHELTLFAVYKLVAFQAMRTLSFLVLQTNILILSQYSKFILKLRLKVFVERIGLINLLCLTYLLRLRFNNTLIRRLLSRGGILAFKITHNPG